MDTFKANVQKGFFLLLIFLCGFAGARLGFTGALDASVAKVGNRVKLPHNKFISFSNEENETLFSMKNYKGKGELNFFVEGKQAFSIRSEAGKLAIGFMDGFKPAALFSHSPDEGLKLTAKDKEERDRMYFSTQGDYPGIVFFNIAKGNKPVAMLEVREKEGGGGRLFLGTPGYESTVASGFLENGTPRLTIKTDDGAMIRLEITAGEPSLVLLNKEGKEKRITP